MKDCSAAGRCADRFGVGDLSIAEFLFHRSDWELARARNAAAGNGMTEVE